MILTNNSSTFNNQHYAQINGTAMATKMAPSNINLIMGKLEKKTLAAAPYSPFIWWRNIDDILFLWTNGEQKLVEIISYRYLNSLHPTINFTSSYSTTKTSFLDVGVGVTSN